MKAKYDNLVLGGGGSKGFGHIGACIELEKLGILGNIKNIASNSVGSLVGFLIAFGYSTEEIKKIVPGLNLSDFMDGNGLIRNSIRLIRKFGWYKGKASVKWIGDRIEESTGNRYTTFKKLHELTKINSKFGEPYRDIYISARDLTLCRDLIISWENSEFENLPVVEAVAMSMGIPILFPPKKVQGYRLIVDGGLGNNYPIDTFDKEDKLGKTLGLYLGSKDEIGLEHPIEVKNMKEFLGALSTNIFRNMGRTHVNEYDWKIRTIFIDTSGYSALDSELTDKEKAELMKRGSDAVKKYLC